MSKVIQEHYQSLYEQHGRSHAAVQYSSRASQIKRYEILLDVAPTYTSLADVGCGLGELLPVLRELAPDCYYQGYDFVESFLDDATAYYRTDNNAQFSHLDILKQTIPDPAEYVVLSGILNNKMDDNAQFTEVTLRKMWQAASKGIAFNALSTYVDYQDEGLCYHDPLELFHFCKTQLSPYVTLRHDYDVKADSIPFEFTMYVYKP